MFQLRGPNYAEHLRPLEPNHYPWHTVAADVGHHSTQHPVDSTELGVDIGYAVRRLQHLHPHGAGSSPVPTILSAPVVPAARIGGQ